MKKQQKTIIDELSSYVKDDEDIKYESFKKHIEDDTERKKSTTASLIFEQGDELLNEIKEKKNEYEIEKGILIDYIIKKSKKVIYKRSSLLKYDIRDVREIYDLVKFENRGFFIKLLEFFQPSSS